MNYPKSRNNVIEAWLKYNYSNLAFEWQLKNKDDDLPFFCRNWDIDMWIPNG
jgi:hypothetical protein